MPKQPKLLFAITTAVISLLTACLDSSQSPPARPDVPPVDGSSGQLADLDLVYVCGNKFLATNSTSSPMDVEYRVVGTRESGNLTLREEPGEDPGFSETEFETGSSGALELYHDDVRVARRMNESLPCGLTGGSASVTAAGTEATVGKWSAPFSWPIIGLHLHLLRTGKVLSWGKFGASYVWTPSSNTFTSVPLPDQLFCSGHTLLADGRLLVTGGHISDNHGIPDANLFDPGTMKWLPQPSMAKGRWYPTTTTLANGEAVTIAGRDQSGVIAGIPEVWTGSGWRALSSARRDLPYYPRTFVAPNGKLFYAGENRASLYLSTSGSGSWTSVASRLYGTRDYGSAVMYQPGKILYAGGGRTTNTAETIDLNQAAPAWKWTGSMAYARRHVTATLLPTGQVLATGGSSGTDFSDEKSAVYVAELWDPSTGIWTKLSSNSVPRAYHSTALLLPDARVLVTGGGDAAGEPNHYNAEIFSPPYLFKGSRPQYSSAPSTVGYGQTFTVGTPTPTAITRVTWVRLGSVTHAFNSNQRFNELRFTRTSSALSVTAPPNRNVAPPGHYMMFLLNSAGVPSTARIVQIK
jgi:hypothetical protein